MDNPDVALSNARVQGFICISCQCQCTVLILVDTGYAPSDPGLFSKVSDKLSDYQWNSKIFTQKFPHMKLLETSMIR